MRSTRSLLVAFAALGATATPATAGGSIGARVDVLPLGRLQHRETGFDSRTEPLGTTVGFAGRITYEPLPNLSIGAVPRFVLELTPDVETGGDSGSQLDLLALLELHGEVSPGLRVAAFGTIGYSRLGFGEPAQGIALGVGAGVERDIGAGTFARVELGYQHASHESRDVRGGSGIPSMEITVSNTTRLLHIGLGVGRRF
ncbi:MAG TPA: hypothetical protein VM261_13880 [Kofleriaceae bacterium]|nr:hypothetical protein [Kofleriaceae bacterium]